MPYARISLHRGKSPEYLQALSQGLHDALVESFKIPDADRFHVIHQHEIGEMIIDPNYLGGPRSHDYVLVERLEAAIGLSPEDVMVVITTTAADEWSFAGGRGN
eukprot:gene23298-27715_t